MFKTKLEKTKHHRSKKSRNSKEEINMFLK